MFVFNSLSKKENKKKWVGGTTNYVNVEKEDYKSDSPEFMIFCHVRLHLWGRVFRRFPVLRGLAFVDDGNMI